MDVINLRTQVLYVSGTGNTERLAEAVYQAIPGCTKDIKKLDSCYVKSSADTYFIGFWVNRGSASVEVLDYLSNLHGKQVALFATCGMGNSPGYYREIERNVSVFLPEDNQYLGAFFCQGKMPMNVRRKYEQMETPENKDMVRRMLRNFDEGLLHPDREDISRAKEFVLDIFRHIQSGIPASCTTERSRL
jgi:flavodoxin